MAGVDKGIPLVMPGRIISQPGCYFFPEGIGIGGKRDTEDDRVLEAGYRGIGAVIGVHREKEKGGGIRY